jgi:hypothetical protein
MAYFFFCALQVVIRVNPTDEGHNTEVIGRLRAELSPEQRAADVRALSDAFRTAYPTLAAKGEGYRLFRHDEVFVESARRQVLWVLFWAVSLVLLISCANTATLLLVRASARQREIAVRASIGASPLRIMQQLLTEGLVLSLTAAALGVAMAVVAVRGFVASAPTALPAGTDLGLDARVLGWAIGVSVLTGIVFGLVAAGPALGARLKALVGSSRGAITGNSRMRDALVLFETARWPSCSSAPRRCSARASRGSSASIPGSSPPAWSRCDSANYPPSTTPRAVTSS